MIKDVLSAGSLRLRENLDLETEVDPEAESEPASGDDDSNGGDTGGFRREAAWPMTPLPPTIALTALHRFQLYLS